MLCFGFIVFMHCELPKAPPPADTYCQIAKPIYFKPTDDRATKEQADRENRKWKRLCANKK